MQDTPMNHHAPKPANRLVPAAVAALLVLLTVASGAIHGRLTHRWTPPCDLGPLAARLQQIPESFGNWQLTGTDKLEDRVQRTLQCDGYILREYANRATGETVLLTVLLGPPGPTSVHTPEICYTSREFETVGETASVRLAGGKGGDHEFRAATFRALTAEATLSRVYYAWSTGARWLVPDQPRVAFAGEPFLYKIQLSGRLPRQSQRDASDVCRRFLQEFLPVVQAYVGPSCPAQPSGQAEKPGA